MMPRGHFPKGGCMRLGLTLCTRHRPIMVQACLLSICREIASAESDVFIVVVENSARKSLTDAFERIVIQFPGVELYYELEPKVGIPIARNRAVDIALRNTADWVAFIDDDEELEVGWLQAMTRAVHELKADALTGPVRTTFQADPPPWLKKQRLDQRRHGQTLETAATNNTLLNCSWLQRRHCPLRFNEELRYTGGSDTEFFRRLTDQGGTIK